MSEVREVMTTDFAWIASDDSVADADRRFAEIGLPAVPVCGAAGRFVGMRLAGQPELDRVTIAPDTPVESADETMRRLDRRRLPVVAGSKLVGILSRADLTADEELRRELGEGVRAVVTEISPRDRMYEGTRGSYLLAGLSALRCIKDSLRAAGKDEVRSILDFACGHGRVLRMLKAAFPEAALTASDIDRDGVAFCASTFGATPVDAEEDPAKTGIEGRFDLIWCGSLFTHLGAERWTKFLAFFETLLEPDGVLVFSTHGGSTAEQLRKREWTFGLSDEQAKRLLEDYDRTGFGYVELERDYGFSISAPSWVTALIDQMPGLQLIEFREKAWARHQDVFCLSRAPGSQGAVTAQLPTS